MFRAQSAPFCAALGDSEFKKRAGALLMYAIIETGGKQYRVSEGDILYIEKLDAEADSTVEFDRVMAVGKEDGTVIGAPVVEGAKVSAKVLKNGKGRRSPSSPTAPRKILSAKWATDSLTPRLKSPRSTPKFFR